MPNNGGGYGRTSLVAGRYKHRGSRRSGKKCTVCGAETLMGVYSNSPANCRERWNGTDYVRFCGPECEAK